MVGVCAVVDLRAALLATRLGSLAQLPIRPLLHLKQILVLLRHLHLTLE